MKSSTLAAANNLHTLGDQYLSRGSTTSEKLMTKINKPFRAFASLGQLGGE